MTVATSSRDLVEQARRRARVGALLGRLLLSEPGSDVAPLVAGITALEPLGAASSELAAEYERLLVREVPVYESVFRSDDGQRGGAVAARVEADYARHGFDEAGAWRVAGLDHLGLELRCYASLCTVEADGWEQDQPDVATRAVEAERDFLGLHLGAWAEVALAAMERRARSGPYRALARAAGEFVAAEAGRLRPDPDHPGLPAVAVDAPPDVLGPTQLVRWLLAPGRCGAFLDTRDLAEAALDLGIPWRPSDPRSRLRLVVDDAVEGGDLPALLCALRPAVERWRDRHVAREAEGDGDRRTWRAWRLRTEATLALIDRHAVAGGSVGLDQDGPVVVEVRGGDEAGRLAVTEDVVGRLGPLGSSVVVSVDAGPTLGEPASSVLAVGADGVLWSAGEVTAVAFADRGDAASRERRHLPDADVVVRLVGATGPVVVTVSGGREIDRDQVADRVADVGDDGVG